MSSRNMPGFTIVELLVVITIIILLLALLTPALDKAMSEAEKVVCGSMERKFALTNSMYATDNRQWYVPIKSENVVGAGNLGAEGPNVENPTWVGGGPYELWYLNRAFIDLLNGGRVEGNWWEYIGAPGSRVACVTKPPQNSFSYAFNWESLGQFEQRLAVNRRRVAEPAAKLQLIDSNDWHTLYEGSDYTRYWDVSGEDPNPAVVTYRHREGANVQFFDMHVEWMAKEDVRYSVEEQRNKRLWWLGGPVNNFPEQ